MGGPVATVDSEVAVAVTGAEARVTADGVDPIAMGVDFPSIDGYAKIATVISAHVPRLGQVRPGEPVRFVRMSTDQSVAELRGTLLSCADREPQREVA